MAKKSKRAEVKPPSKKERKALAARAAALAAEIARGVDLASGTVTQVSDREEAAAVAGRALQPSDVVVVKASRGLALDRVADLLAAGGREA